MNEFVWGNMNETVCVPQKGNKNISIQVKWEKAQCDNIEKWKSKKKDEDELLHWKVINTIFAAYHMHPDRKQSSKTIGNEKP